MRTASVLAAIAMVAWTGAAHAAGASFQAAVQPIFDANCVACHQTGAASQGLNLESGRSYAAVVNRRSSEADLPLVAPNSPDTSYLLLKVLGIHAKAGGNGERMPLGGTLAASEIETLRAWIVAGAKDD